MNTRHLNSLALNWGRSGVPVGSQKQIDTQYKCAYS